MGATYAKVTKEPMAGSVRVAASIKKIQSVDKSWFNNNVLYSQIGKLVST